ncbi:ThuA domain-containing protein [Planctomycetales bacterium ZRK34]|nr:ThuA domain-containing protein [Planctomycetales bacterium ZRK34]
MLKRLVMIALWMITPSLGFSAERVLIVTGEDYKGHRWQQTTPVLKAAIEVDDRLQVDVLDDLTKLAATDLAPYRAVVMHFKNYDANVPGRAGFDALSKYVHHGGGLVLVHFACGAFQECKDDFEKLVGRVWDPKLRGHDPFGPFTVRITDHDHPITAGMSDFETDDELYTCLAGEVSIHPIAVARSKVDHKDYPMAFVLTVGKGRVFHSVLGHDVKALSVPAVGELYRRGTVWAAGLKQDKGASP